MLLKNILISMEEIFFLSDSEFLSYNLMLNSPVVRKKISEQNNKP